ncbi:MAG: hypothetical protein ICV66_02075 [Chitinophagaceae bacterium]|nr:hypothetical protein [Chitinophagaceae bacterium]
MQNTDLTQAVIDLLTSCFEGPEHAGSWITDPDPKSGIFGTLEGITAKMASQKVSSKRATIAAHTEHLRYHLSVVHKAFMGENAFETANWQEAWTKEIVTEEKWQKRVQQLKNEFRAVCDDIRSSEAWKNNRIFLTGTLAIPAHSAYHLGAIRQIIGLIKK